MIDDEQLIEVLAESEFLMDGLDKGFWRFIKLSRPEIWDNTEDHEAEYIWVIGIMGNRCIAYDDSTQAFTIATWETYGEITSFQQLQAASLLDLVAGILRSRFVIL